MTKHFLLLPLLFLFVEASQVNLTKDIPSIDVTVNGEKVTISRIQDANHKLNNEYSLTSRLSPPFEIQPYTVVEGVKTISELEIFTFIQEELKKGGLLVDARLSHWFEQSTIPTAINVPFTSIVDYKKTKVFKKFSVSTKKGKLDFSKAKQLLIFDNGPWCPQASEAIKTLITLGYPKEKILYYRGGMQYWSILGLHYAYPKGENDVK